MAITKEDVVTYISNISVLELADLVKEFETKFGVSAAAPVAVAGVAGGGAAGAAAAEEKTAFNLHLEAVGDKKIDVIKVVRVITGLGLKEAKDLVEGAPKMVKDGLSKEDVEKFKKELEAVGAKVKID
jgi:large subunit ribosomal protein L7/L12